MTDPSSPASAMLGRIAAQLMVLYDDAASDGRTDAAEAYAPALNVVRTETDDVPIRFGGPPPTLRTIPRTSFPEELVDRLAPVHRPGRNGAG